MKNKYIVTSSTSREAEGHPELCWMEIRVDKLNDAVAENKDYEFRCCIGDDEFGYTYPANELLQKFVNNVRINKGKNDKCGKYSFYFDYESGNLYHTLTKGTVEDNFICSLNSKDGKGIKTIKAEEELNEVLAKDNLEYKLAQIIASTAHFVELSLFSECEAKGSVAKYPWIRRKGAKDARGWISKESKDIVQQNKKNNVWPKGLLKEHYLDDNSYPNSQMKAAMKRAGYKLEGYETCHIWQNKCNDTKCHTCYANLVLLPRSLASLSDHNEYVQSVLKYKAFCYFGWKPEGEPEPEKPEKYDDIKWLYYSDKENKNEKK